MSRYPAKTTRQRQPQPQPNRWRSYLSLTCIGILAWVSIWKSLPSTASTAPSQPPFLVKHAYRSTLTLRDEAFVSRSLSRHNITQTGPSSILVEQSLILVERVWAQIREPAGDGDDPLVDLGSAFIEVLQSRENMPQIPGGRFTKSNATYFVTTIFDIVAELQDRAMDRRVPQDWSTSFRATTGLAPEALQIVATTRHITDKMFDDKAFLSIDTDTAAAMDFLQQKVVPLIRMSKIVAMDRYTIHNSRQTLREHKDKQRKSLDVYRIKAGENVNHELRTTRMATYWAACISDTYIDFYDIILSLCLGDRQAREATAAFLATHERNTRARERLLVQYVDARFAELEPLAEHDTRAFLDAFRGESGHILDATSPNKLLPPLESHDAPAAPTTLQSQTRLRIRSVTMDGGGEVSLGIVDGPGNVMKNLQEVLEEVVTVDAKARERRELLYFQARKDFLAEQTKVRDELLRRRDQVLEAVLPAWKLMSKWPR